MSTFASMMYSVAAKMITLDASPGCVVVKCQCGYSTVRVTREAATAAADRHRTAVHPRQATYAASKRRARSQSGTLTT